ncbi:MAG: nuclease-related domain-containing protein [Synechococcus sp.]
MSIKRNAGQNIRQLALRRRIKAATMFASAAFVLVIPIIIVNSFSKLIADISSTNATQSEGTLSFPSIYYAFFILIAIGLASNGLILLKRARHADQGAQGEEDVAVDISRLKKEGWNIEYGMRLGNRLGDADIFCISPKKRAFVIDVKSHRGLVITDGKQLQRQMGSKTYAFEKNFLSQVMKQALQVKKQNKLKFVTPIICFSDAQVSIPKGKTKQVYVVDKTRLVPLLKSLG